MQQLRLAWLKTDEWVCPGRNRNLSFSLVRQKAGGTIWWVGGHRTTAKRLLKFDTGGPSAIQVASDGGATIEEISIRYHDTVTSGLQNLGGFFLGGGVFGFKGFFCKTENRTQNYDADHVTFYILPVTSFMPIITG